MRPWTPNDKLRWASLVRRDHRLTTSARLIAGFFQEHVNDTGRFWVSKRRTADKLGFSTKTVQRSIRQLERLGYLVSTPRTGTTPLYEIVPSAPHADTGGRSPTTDVSRGRHGSPKGEDGDVPQISEESKIRIFFPLTPNDPVSITKVALEDWSLQSQKVVRKPSNILRRPDRGKYEVAIANRLGPNGMAILGSLPKPKLAWLLRKQQEGSLTEADLADVCLIFRRGGNEGGGT